jgi:hypothetical protein
VSDLADAAQSRATLTVGDGEVFTLAPLTFADWGMFDRWMADTIMSRAQRAMRAAATLEEREAIQRAAQAQALSATISAVFFNLTPDSANQVKALLYSPVGTVQVVWFSLRHEQPSISLDQAARVCDLHEDATDLIDRILRLSGLIRDPVMDDGKKNGQTTNE